MIRLGCTSLKLSLSLALLLAAATAARAEETKDAVEQIFKFATPETPGCAAGFSRDGKIVLNRAWGLADVEQKRPLDEKSLFDIGSTQKQFTAAAILLLVEDGRLALTDDVRKHLPQLPDYGAKLTVDHLLTHTGGIRDWTGILPMAPEGTDVLTLIQRQRGLNFVPGTQWAYSNSGFELAKAIVAKVSGMSFADFTRKRLFEPLGMSSTAYVPDILQAGEHAAIGYQKAGTGWERYMRLGNRRGGGAIVSTIGDLLLWNQALAAGTLGKTVTAKLHEPARLRNGRTLRYTRGLMIDATPDGTVISHSGGAAGFSTWMGRVPEHNLAVVVACNFDPVSATELGGELAELYLPPVDPKNKRPELVAAEGVDVTGRAGLFFDETTGEPLRLVVSRGRLQVAGGPPLVAIAADRFRNPRGHLFFRSQDEFEMRWTSADRFEIKSMEGELSRFRRAQPWKPSAADLQAFSRRYRSDDLAASFELIPANGGLTLRSEDAPEKSVELEPVDRDTFMRSMMVVRFTRDDEGKVTGFVYGNPVAKNLPFTRVGDRADAPAAEAPTSVEVPAAATPAANLESLTGEYELAPGRTLAITLEGGTLYGQPGDGPKRTLALVSGTTFSVSDTPMTVTFSLGDDGRATAVVMRQGGKERTLPRLAR